MTKQRQKGMPPIPSAIPAKTISAREMAEAIKVVAHKLNQNHIIEQQTLSVMLDESGRLERKGRATSWDLLVERERPILFSEFISKTGVSYYPCIVFAKIDVAGTTTNYTCFTNLDIALEISTSDRKVISRWHVDMANHVAESVQDGPLFHLQYGGQCSDGTGPHHPLSIPRWNHPPLDILLLCEIVAANFYPDKWDILREDINWCSAVTLSQCLCYSIYLNKMVDQINQTGGTSLHSMWASEWKLGI